MKTTRPVGRQRQRATKIKCQVWYAVSRDCPQFIKQVDVVWSDHTYLRFRPGGHKVQHAAPYVSTATECYFRTWDEVETFALQQQQAKVMRLRESAESAAEELRRMTTDFSHCKNWKAWFLKRNA